MQEVRAVVVDGKTLIAIYNETAEGSFYSLPGYFGKYETEKIKCEVKSQLGVDVEIISVLPENDNIVYVLCKWTDGETQIPGHNEDSLHLPVLLIFDKAEEILGIKKEIFQKLKSAAKGIK